MFEYGVITSVVRKSEVGYIDYLSERFKMNAPYIVDAVKKVLARK